MKTDLVKHLVAVLGVFALNLNAQPVITNQPASQTMLEGATAVFSAQAAGGAPLAFQWQFNGTNLPNNIITTVVGNGPNYPTNGSYSGDGNAATNAGLFWPSGVAFDVAGSMYISDTYNSCIRKVNANGNITTVAGKTNYSITYAGI